MFIIAYVPKRNGWTNDRISCFVIYNSSLATDQYLDDMRRLAPQVGRLTGGGGETLEYANVKQVEYLLAEQLER